MSLPSMSCSYISDWVYAAGASGCCPPLPGSIATASSSLEAELRCLQIAVSIFYQIIMNQSFSLALIPSLPSPKPNPDNEPNLQHKFHTNYNTSLPFEELKEETLGFIHEKKPKDVIIIHSEHPIDQECVYAIVTWCIS